MVMSRHRPKSSTFWREAGRDRWYEKDDAFDAEVRRRYLGLWRKADAGELSSWEASDDGALALVIVLDQFPRNMFRGGVRGLCERREGARGRGPRHRPRRRCAGSSRCCSSFSTCRSCIRSILPDQLRCVELFRSSPDNLKYAEQHADIIRRFGRFPHRNRVLGRATTAEEQAFLDGGGFSG